MQGKGKWTFLDHEYEGNFIDNKKCGKGTMRYFTGNTYSGNWENDLPRMFFLFYSKVFVRLFNF